MLERSNFNEMGSPDFDWGKGYITTREEIYSVDIRRLTDEEITQAQSDFYHKVMFLYPRNGIERIISGNNQYLNLLILDYPLNDEWEKDNDLLGIIDYLTNKYHSLKSDKNSMEKQVKDIGINNIVEVDSIGGIQKSEIEFLYNLLIKEGYEFEVIYEESSVYNAGATGGHITLILNFIGHVANITGVIEFFKKYYSDAEERISSYNMEVIKKEISIKYKIYEDQLTLESYKYNDIDDRMEYVFVTRYERFLVYMKNGKIINSSRNKNV